MMELIRLKRELEKARTLYLWLRDIPADQYGGFDYHGDLRNAQKKVEFIEREIETLKTTADIN